MTLLLFRHLADPGTFFRPAAEDRKPNRFRSTYTDTLRALDEELRHLGATEATARVVLAAGEADLRLDGALRANAEVVHPGVVLTIVTRDHGTLVYPCDAFAGRYTSDPPDWQLNLRAISLGLEKLRRLDDYGITTRGEQYAGFRELGAGTPLGSGMTVREALDVLLDAAGATSSPVYAGLRALDRYEILQEPGAVDRLYREASRRLHPDRPGGDAAAFARVTEARDLLRGNPRE